MPVDEINVVNDVELCPIFVLHVGMAPISFVKALSLLCLKQYDVKLIPLYRTEKGDNIKSATLLPISSNVANKFTCSCHANLT